jgi:hypothetical protein
MSSTARVPAAWRVVSGILVALAALAGLWYGYGFGDRLGGMWLGALLSLVAAVLGSMLLDGALDWLASVFWRGEERE